MNILTSLPQWNHYVVMKNYVEMKHCVEMNIWLIDANLSVNCRILRIVKFDITRLFKKAYHMNIRNKNHFRLQNSKHASWWRFKLIQHSLNSWYCLRKLNEKSEEKRFIYIHLFLPLKNSNSSNMTQ